MEDHIRRKQDKFKRQDAFMIENAADFPNGSPGDEFARVNRAVAAEIDELAAQQVSGGSSSRQSIDSKGDDLDRVWEILKSMNGSAIAFDYQEPGSAEKYRLPYNRSEQNILATARAWRTDSESLEAKFVRFGTDAGYREELQTLLTRIEAHNAQSDTNLEKRGEATGGLTDAAKRGMENSRRLDRVVRNVYKNNPRKLAAWIIASHLEAAPKREPKPPTE